MQILFDMDKRDYNENGRIYSRPSVRAVVVRGVRLQGYSGEYT